MFSMPAKVFVDKTALNPGKRQTGGPFHPVSPAKAPANRNGKSLPHPFRSVPKHACKHSGLPPPLTGCKHDFYLQKKRQETFFSLLPV